MKMKRKTIVWLTVVTLFVTGVSTFIWRRAAFVQYGVAHQQPYKWDSYVRPDLQFTMEPMTNVIAKVNAIIRDVSNNVVPEAIKLDTTPTRIVKIDSTPSLDPHMNKLISDFRENEKEMNRRGAAGFENTPFTGSLEGDHSLWCTLVGPNDAGLYWEPQKDALHVSRMPRMMQCRPYKVTKGLRNLVEKNRKANSLHVNCEPIVSALIDATGIHSWSIMLPDGPNSWTSEFRYGKVFKYVPDYNVILALTTPEEHAKAENKLKALGIWIEPKIEDSSNRDVKR